MSTKREAGASATAEQRIGPALKRLRESAGLSLRTLADQIGFSASFLSQAENGVVSPSINSLEKMASALGVTLADLFSVEPTTEGTVVRAHARPNFRSAWSKARIDALMPSGGSRTLEALMVMRVGWQHRADARRRGDRVERRRQRAGPGQDAASMAQPGE